MPESARPKRAFAFHAKRIVVLDIAQRWSESQTDSRGVLMKIAGLLLLLAGWGLVLAAVVFLAPMVARGSFVLAGTAVEGLGFGLFIRSQWLAQRERG